MNDTEIKAHLKELDNMTPEKRAERWETLKKKLSPERQKELGLLARVAVDKSLKVLNEYTEKELARNTITRKIPGGMLESVNNNFKGVNMHKIYTRDNPNGIEEPEHGFKSLGQFAQAIINASGEDGVKSPTLTDWAQKTAGTMEIGDSAQGGYLVPSQFINNIYTVALEQSIVRNRSFYLPMTTNHCEIPASVTGNHTENLFGGISIKRTGEGQLIESSNPALEKIGLTLHKAAGLVHVTNELLEDNQAGLEAWLQDVFPQAIAFVMDEDFLNGSGANQPLGMLNSANPALITVTAVGGQGASTVITENVITMWSRMYSAGKKSCIWVYNPEVFPELAKMSLQVGTGGIPVFMPANAMSDSPYAQLMGRPLIETEKCQALGTAGDIALIDPTAYVIGSKGNGEAKFSSSMHLKFDYDMQSFRWTMRYDGQPRWSGVLTPKYGTSTVSPFIVLSSSRA
jgi:HK97 family phage major capsid protein